MGIFCVHVWRSWAAFIKRVSSRSDEASPFNAALAASHMRTSPPPCRRRTWGYGKMETACLGAQCAQWILTRGKEHNIRLVHTRNYVPRQTAFYADWPLFQEDELACQFLSVFPRFQIPNRLQTLQHDGQIIAIRVEERLQRGGFDIGKHPAEQRRAIAQRYIELDDKLRDIDEHCRGLELAEQLSLEWMKRLVAAAKLWAPLFH